MDRKIIKLDKLIRYCQTEIANARWEATIKVHHLNYVGNESFVKILCTELRKIKKSTCLRRRRMAANAKLTALVKLEMQAAKEWMKKTGYAYPQLSETRYVKNGSKRVIKKITEVQHDDVIKNAAMKYGIKYLKEETFL